MKTPEKPRDSPRGKIVRKMEDGPSKTTVSFLHTNANTHHIPFTSTTDKTRR